MKIEKIIGLVLLAVLIATALIYLTSPKTQKLEDKDYAIVKAPEISTPDGFVNTDGRAITLEQYQGNKVVLLDIWTYSCINCQRTLPYLNDWYEKYSDKGLEIVGLHTPEFAFEHKIENVEDAVERFKIKYPVVLDNDFSTWRELGNSYWPRKYLIDLDGNIVYDHIGEGGYEETEKAIQELLDVSESIEQPEGVVSVDREGVNSPEIYFGAWRNDRLANGDPRTEGVKNFVIGNDKTLNSLYLGGTWDIKQEHAESVSDSEISFRFSSKDVYMVASSNDETELEIYLNGTFSHTVKVKEEGLYTVIDGDRYEEGLLEIKVKDAGFKIFTFTFG
jgi:thiol-disulfide isomerase/thioredoxin